MALKEIKSKRKQSLLMGILCLGLLVLGLVPPATAQKNALDWLIDAPELEQADAVGIHPRGLLLPEEVPVLRKRLAEERYSGVLSAYREKAARLEKALQIADPDARQLAESAEMFAILHLLSGEARYSDQAFSQLERLFQDRIIFNNPVSRGLTRAAVLRSLAMAYDLCYTGWSPDQRNRVNRQLYKLTYTTQANMGAEANYSLVSNWMGVRWGAALFAGMVWDNPFPDERSLMDPLVWDATKRLMDHIRENIYPQGWNAESIGYHLYNWSFIGPALIAFQNRQGQGNSRSALEILAPTARGAIRAMAPTMVSIFAREGLTGMKPDLSDDNLNLGTGFFGLAFRLYPQAELPEIKWMHDYLGDSSLYSLMYYPAEIRSKNPGQSGWLNHADSTQGVAVFRNRFADDTDVVAVFNTSSKRIAGHKGPDVNTFRIIGGGVPLVIGAGRTGKIAGQTNVFPHVPDGNETGQPDPGSLLDFGFDGSGSGFAIGEGSSTGVMEHRRTFTVRYDEASGAEAVFLIEDHTENGRIWRMATPEFNEVRLSENGFTIDTSTGYRLHVLVLGKPNQALATVSTVPYGGRLSRVNPGIVWNGRSYTHSKVIDLEMEAELTVLMVLQAPGQPEPQVRLDEGNARVFIANLAIELEKK
ncbi:hypothetical protein SAMN05192553_104106 [Cyclobacterium xiamenense]|uniref:Heparinase II/III-like protein n=1 Tax=Cyclobacterium xiamenense TaxID=1297121 RepID=A0A1H6YZG8_9BACT|nr:hypothetical protein [Cyclobacterium xiamenense]SEJ46643.1 hypothetical protein SAMN05192553_104106 [Cyclobacterium xiamenense]